MRRSLEGVAIFVLLATWAITCMALLGSSRVSGTVAIHFDAAGRPNGWGEASSLWILPVLASLIYLVLTVVARTLAPSSDPTPEIADSRTRILSLTGNMIAWLKTEIICLFSWIQFEIIRGARQGHLTLSPLFLPVVLAVVAVTFVWSIVPMWQAARTR